MGASPGGGYQRKACCRHHSRGERGGQENAPWTQAGMVGAAESINDGLRRARQLMVEGCGLGKTRNLPATIKEALLNARNLLVWRVPRHGSFLSNSALFPRRARS